VLVKQDDARSTKGCKCRDTGVLVGAAGARCRQEPHDAGAWGSVPRRGASHGEWTDRTHQV